MFLAISLYDNIQVIMIISFPEAIIKAAEVIASTRRIQVNTCWISYIIISISDLFN